MSIWTESRENESNLIRDRLTELADQGCEVRVIMQRRENEIADLLEEAGAEVVEYPDGRVDVHSKNLLIDADFETIGGDVERRREVWTGSQNLSRPGLRRNDETLLRIVDEYVYNEFVDDWERVYQQAKLAEIQRSVQECGDENGDTGDEEGTEERESTEAGRADEENTAHSGGENETDRESVSPISGFGVGTAAIGIASGLAYAIRRRFARDPPD